MYLSHRLPESLRIKNPPAMQELWVWFLGEEDPLEDALKRAWQPTPVFLPEESHGQRSPVGYDPWGHKESDMTEWLSMHASQSYMELIHATNTKP